MKKTVLAMMALGVFSINAQSVKSTNVYPTNLAENMYYENYNPATNMVEGIYFLVLSDGENSQDRTPAFEVAIYLLPEGSTSREDVIIAKSYKLDGIYHMGSHEFKAEKLNLNDVSGLMPGNYRMGLWVNHTESFSENTDDNAAMFQGALSFKGYTTNVTPTTEPKKEENSWGEWEEEEEEEEEW